MWGYVGSSVLVMEYPEPPPNPVQRLIEPPKAGEQIVGAKASLQDSQ